MNIYSNPQAFGLQQVGHHDFSDGSYQFDYRVVWYHKENEKLYTARDSGCSCPSPFEDYQSITELQPFDLNALISEAKTNMGYSDYAGDSLVDWINKLHEIDDRYNRSPWKLKRAL